MNDTLTARAAASIRELLEYLESEFMGSHGMIGDSAGVAKRADAVLAELEGHPEGCRCAS